MLLDTGQVLSEDDAPEEKIRKLKSRIDARKADVDERNSLYRGARPLRFASPEFDEQVGGLFEGFSDNWCKTVPDTLRERLEVVSFEGEDGNTDTEAMRAWKRTRARVDVNLAILDALVVARSHALVWNPSGEESDITFIPAGEAIVDYAPGTRNVRRSALRIWSDGSHEFATLFTRAYNGRPPMVYRRQRTLNAGEWVTRTIGLRRSELPDFVNPMGNEIPIVEIANRSRLHGDPESELDAVAPLQDGINTLWAHLFTGADFAALPQRVVMGMDKPVTDILDEDGNILYSEDLPLGQYSKARILWLSKNGAQIGQFTPADLEAYLKVISQAVRHIAAQTRTPPQYLLGEMANIAADALEAAESGLVAKASDRQTYFGEDLLEVMRLEALAADQPARAASLAMGRTVWRDPQYRSVAQYADALTKYKAIGVPDEALWRMIPGVTEEQVTEWIRMRDAQAQAAAEAASAALSAFGPKDGATEDEGPEDEEEA
ncbi:phage portal protein [Streptomyces cyaneofuscatus]|uniref:phage portal protein n=1 Tax=Streptomyces cyaneofuscatus TaxID=66883 RepID=UPI0029538294|nr:phage portal protein [Streptomyces cyaneofuscatus]WOP11818.1 phage portal protein [Streptomyces cyaneofuscatus]